MKYTYKKGIDKDAKKQMKKIIDSLSTSISEQDIITLQLLEDALHTYHIADKGLLETGYVVTNNNNNIVTSPWVKIKLDAKLESFKIMKQFGMNLLDRKKLESGTIEEDNSLLNKFLNDEKE